MQFPKHPNFLLPVPRIFFPQVLTSLAPHLSRLDLNIILSWEKPHLNSLSTAHPRPLSSSYFLLLVYSPPPGLKMCLHFLRVHSRTDSSEEACRKAYLFVFLTMPSPEQVSNKHRGEEMKMTQPAGGREGAQRPQGSPEELRLPALTPHSYTLTRLTHRRRWGEMWGPSLPSNQQSGQLQSSLSMQMRCLWGLRGLT